jgi:type 1 fimbria pilin
MVFCFYGNYASACYYYKDYNPKAATNLVIDMGSVTIASDGVGGVIASKEGAMTSFGGAPAAFSCGTNGDSTPAKAGEGVSGDGTSTTQAIYDTNIPGIGIKIYYYTLSSYQNEPLEPTQIATKFPVTISTPYNTKYQNTNAALKIELVKTDSVSGMQSGLLTFTRTKLLGVDNNAGYDDGALNLANLTVKATITSNTCDVDASTPTRVDMASVNANSMSVLHKTSGDTPFDITLNCSGNTDVNLLLDGEEDQNAPGVGVLTNKSGGNSAKGVGIQLLHDDNPVEFEETFSVGQSTKGKFIIPMVARYYRTTSQPIKAGDVSSSVVYNLSYK